MLQRSDSQVKKGAMGDIGGLQPRFGSKGTLYATEGCAHTFEGDENAVAYTAEEAAAMTKYAELEGKTVGTYVTMAVDVVWTELKESKNGPYVLATVEHIGGAKEQLRMWQRDLADVPRDRVCCVH